MTSTPETGMRERLAIPAGAERVLLLVESTHWDPGWLLTSEQYYRWNVRRVIDRAIDELLSDPRRVYNLECVFYLRKYWEQNPHRADDLRRLINEGRLRFSAPGITTPDTLLPTEESLLRDMQMGFQWLQDRGCRTEPRVLYLPDSFGHTPGLPSLARAAGLDRVAFTRIDGMYFAGAEREPRHRFPRPGSSAELLLTTERTNDFVWRDSHGSEVLAHWNAFGYGQGDMIAAKGISRWMGVPFIYRAARSEPEVRARIEGYLADLLPVSRTPYLLCPIGSDFVPPIPQLGEVIDLWNQTGFDRTGVWLMSGSLDQYFDLVEPHRADLPVLELDPNPYWTGFYSSRLELKRTIRLLADTLTAAEMLAAARDPSTAGRIRLRLREPAAALAFSNHHDFITGTSPDRVINREQRPLLERALEQTDRVLAGLVGAGSAVSPHNVGKHVSWEESGSGLHMTTPQLEMLIDPSRGGCLVEAVERITGRPLVKGPAFDLVSWYDRGGLWRMGNEFPGGRLREVDRTSRRPAVISIEESTDGLKVEVRAELEDRATVRRLHIGPDHLQVTTTVAARNRRTVTLRVPTAFALDTLAMGQPGAAVARPTGRHYRPTFWPVSSWIEGRSEDGRRSLAISVGSSTAVSATDRGGLDVVVARNAPQELSWGIVPFRGMPARGHERDVVTMVTTWWFTGADGEAVAARHASLQTDGLAGEARRAFEIDRDDVILQASRGAADGRGVILRLRALGSPGGWVTVRPPWEFSAAFRCDALERNIASLTVVNGTVTAEMTEPFLTVRLLA